METMSGPGYCRDRPWLRSFPPEVDQESGATTQFASLVDFLEAGFRSYAARTACISLGASLSYAELDRNSGALAAYLQGLEGVVGGDRVALLLPNCFQYPVSLFGLWRAGLVGVNCNPLYTTRELRQQLLDSGARVVVVLENFAATLALAIEGTAVRHVIVSGLGDGLDWPRSLLVNGVNRHWRRAVPYWRISHAVPWRRALSLGRRRALKPVAPDLQAPALLQYTGGTTGVPKAAVLTHANLLANIAQARSWIQGHLHEDGSELVVTALPLPHIFALTANCLTFFGIGAVNLLILDPRDLDGLVRQLARHPFTVITGVNTLFDALLHQADFAGLDFSRLRLVLGGGMAVTPAVAERWQRVTGVPLVQAYGLTEASPAVSINPLGVKDFTGSIGLPLPGTEIDIRDEAGVSLPLGELGEICVAGPQVMGGYWHQPEEDAQVFWADGYLRTGDLGYMDAAGYLWLKERCKDVILVSGFNVYPGEVEAVLAEHPGVSESAVVGRMDSRSGECVKAFVVRRDPGLNEAALVAHCRARLAPYKVPRQVAFVESLPKNVVGKIMRRSLREEGSQDCA